MKRYITLIALLIFAVTSCGKKGFDPKKQSEIDDADIRSYLALYNIDAQKDDSGIYYQITKPGNTIHPEADATVTVHTEIKLLDGTHISTLDSTQPLANFIKGLRIGIPLLDKGAEAIILVPSGLAYGSDNVGAIPPNSVLVYNIKLVGFTE
ncbi:MAG: FKBP-type peptidyl-prolyl cis-trans isomerase [Mucilaginibacter sp.]